MKILHTSDWHLGRQFHNVSLLDDQRFILEQLLEYVVAEQVDVLLIAGDIYDRSIPPVAAVSLLDEVLHRLCVELKIKVVIISGNHDSAARLDFATRHLRASGLYIVANFSGYLTPIELQIEDNKLHIYALPYHDPELIRNQFAMDVKTHAQAHDYLVEQINAVKRSDAFNVLISHCFVAGGLESDSERPLSIGGADCVNVAPLLNFDYVALGHLHQPQFKQAEFIRYSGSLLKYSFSEQHQRKSVTLVAISNNQIQNITQLPLKAKREMRIIEGELQQIIQAGLNDAHADDYVLIRLTDSHAVLDVMSKLRAVYPNVLHLEKPGLNPEKKHINASATLKRDELELFADFYQQMLGQALTEPQQALLEQTVKELREQGE